MRDADDSVALADAIRAAAAERQPLALCGGGSKAHLGRCVEAGHRELALATHRGIVHYAPSELVMTARAGTPLSEIEATLADHGQMLPFEPPHHGPQATLGGIIACGVAGPARFARGAARDFVLGVQIINGSGEVLRFGGQVMKNVAGYDVSRLMVGAFGTLGALLEISLKVLPRPATQVTVQRRCRSTHALALFAHGLRQPLPITGAAWCDGQLRLRLEGAEPAVDAAIRALDGDVMDPTQAQHWWADLRDLRLPFFAGQRPLWRLSLPPAAAVFPESGDTLLDWAGAQRWMKSSADPDAVFAAAETLGGHATLYRQPQCAGQQFAPLSPGVAHWHRQLKRAFDPAGILNPGRLYAEF